MVFNLLFFVSLIYDETTEREEETSIYHILKYISTFSLYLYKNAKTNMQWFSDYFFFQTATYFSFFEQLLFSTAFSNH